MKKQVALLFSFSFLFLFSISLASAQYVTGDIYITSVGEAKFSVETNLNPDIEELNFDVTREKLTGTTEMLTEKKKGTWTFTLNLKNYETILLDIHLPKNLKSIESLQGVDNTFNINKKIISLIDNNKKLEFEVSYQLEKNTDYFWLFILLILILVSVVIYLILKRKKKQNKLDFILPIINDNEKKIIQLLMKKPIRQKEIRKKLEIPKASFSRYIINLEKKKLILREGEGKNKIVKLK
jgi:uncharacterized membrane protein